MIHLMILDASGPVVHNLTRLICTKIRHPLLPEVVVTRVVFDGNPYPMPRVYIHSNGGYYGDEIDRLTSLCASFGLSIMNDGKIHYPELGREPVVVFYGGAADGVEEAIREGHAIDALAKLHQARVTLCRPPAGTWTVSGLVQIAEFRPSISRADPRKANALDQDVINYLRAWGYNVEAFKVEGGEPGMTFFKKFEH